MPNLQHHIIRKQTLHLELFGTESQGLALQQELPQMMAQHVVYAMENVFNRYSILQEYIAIDYLEIDAGNLSLERLEYDLAEQVELCLDKALREKLLRIQDVRDLGQKNDGLDDVQRDASLRSTSQSLCEAFIYFLRTGRLPWSFQLDEGERFEDRLLHTWKNLAPSQRDLWQVEVRAALADENVRTRLVFQFSTILLTQLLELLLPNAYLDLSKIILHINKLQLIDDSKKWFTKLFWQVTVRSMARDAAVNVKDVMQQLSHLMPTQSLMQDTPQLEVIQRFFERYGVDLLPANLSVLKSNALQNQAKKGTDQTDLVNHQLVSNKLDTAKFVHGVDTHKNVPAPLSTSVDVKEGIYINVAGLVLLHPFLPQFFNALGIVVNDEVVQPSRALSLLHYLATGQKNAAEYELVLAKILCNIPLSMPVELDVEFSNTEIAEANQLLEAVINHWGVLKNTSVDGLRGTYLIRAGKLTMREDGDWLLQVESKSYDILLGSLPWGFSMIQLPWMPKMLWVEWVS